MILEDDSPMPFGKFKNKPMQDVPVNYLHWAYHNTDNVDIKDYCIRNLDALKQENEDLIWSKL